MCVISGYKWVYLALFIGFVIFLSGLLSQVLILNSHTIFIDQHGANSWKVKTSRKSSTTDLSLKISRESNLMSPSHLNIDNNEIRSVEPLTTLALVNPIITKAVVPTSAPSLVPTELIEQTDDLYSKFWSDAIHSSGVEKAVRESSESTTSSIIADYLSSGNRIPIVLLTCNRPELLEQTIASLLKVKGLQLSNVMVSQDGLLPSVTSVVNKHKIYIVHNTEVEQLRLRGAMPQEGSTTIAKHYKFSLDKAFEHFSAAPAIIIIEDDLLFSPDFLEYLEGVSPVIDLDPTVMFISAWNDNGFKGIVKNPWALLRTDFFPGLGWLLPRRLYEKELKDSWPKEHWDHWLRAPERHKGREIVYPEVPRTFHNGIKGTFMNLETHNRYFKNIAFNNDSSISWAAPAKNLLIRHPSKSKQPLPLYEQAIKSVYDARIENMISKCIHVNALRDIIADRPSLYCIWINLKIEGDWGIPAPFEPVAQLFGIWHEHKRGSRRGLHEFHWMDNGSYILLLNIHESLNGNSYQALMPPNTRVINPQDFDKNLVLEAKRIQLRLEGIPSDKPNISCDQVCANKGKKCRNDLIGLLNSCVSLNKAFPCRDCRESIGADQPAYVSLTADAQFNPGTCFYNKNPETTTCASSHKATMRLCACS